MQGPQNVILWFAPASQNGLKGKIRDLKQQFEEFWEQKNLQRGAAAEGRRPLCRFLRDPKLFRLVLKSWIFSFQSFRACQGSQNWAHWGLSKKEYKIIFESVQGPQNVIFESPCKPKWIERNKYETLSSSSKNFERDTYKGGRGALAPRPPL